MNKFNKLFLKILCLVVILFGAVSSVRGIYEGGYPWISFLVGILALFLIINLTVKIIKN